MRQQLNCILLTFWKGYTVRKHSKLSLVTSLVALVITNKISCFIVNHFIAKIKLVHLVNPATSVGVFCYQLLKSTLAFI